MDGIIHHDSVHFVVLVCLEDGFLDIDTDVGRVPELSAGGADETKLVGDTEGFTGFTSELRERSERAVSLPALSVYRSSNTDLGIIPRILLLRR